jgi:hypothetical protein
LPLFSGWLHVPLVLDIFNKYLGRKQEEASPWPTPRRTWVPRALEGWAHGAGWPEYCPQIGHRMIEMISGPVGGIYLFYLSTGKGPGWGRPSPNLWKRGDELQTRKRKLGRRFYKGRNKSGHWEAEFLFGCYLVATSTSQVTRFTTCRPAEIYSVPSTRHSMQMAVVDPKGNLFPFSFISELWK